jgi:hypothetical protein
MLSKHHQRRCVAYHEAGHAIVARVLRTSVEWILIGKRVGLADGIAGEVTTGPAPGGAIDEVTISLAGKAAEFKAGYRSSGMAEASDLKQARHYLGARVALMPVITRRAEAIVNRHWYDIQALALVLQRRRRLEGADFNSLMHQRGLGRPPPLDLEALPDGADIEAQVLYHQLVYPEYPSPPPPDRVSVPDGAKSETRLLVFSLIYPEPRNPVSAEWVQLTLSDLCPKLAAGDAASLLRGVVNDLKASLRDPYASARNSVIADVELIESLAIAADRYRARPRDEPVKMARHPRGDLPRSVRGDAAVFRGPYRCRPNLKAGCSPNPKSMHIRARSRGKNATDAPA